jgi:hypothetical protein
MRLTWVMGYGRTGGMKDKQEKLKFAEGDDAMVFDPLLYIDDIETPIETTMKLAKVMRSYNDEHGLAMADVVFEHDRRYSRSHYQGFMLTPEEWEKARVDRNGD